MDLFDNRRLSRATQRMAVSEGLALGMHWHEIPSLPNDRRLIEEAFGAAFLGWHSAAAFPLVQADAHAGRAMWGTVTYARTNRMSWLFHWQTSKTELTPLPRSEIHLLELGLDAFALDIPGGLWMTWDWGDLAWALRTEIQGINGGES